MGSFQTPADFCRHLQSKLVEVSELIQQILKLKQSLDQNSCLVKDDIQSSFDSHVLSLKQRNVQLLRQIDVLASRQENRLQVELAKLYQYQGSLNSLLRLCEAGELKMNPEYSYDLEMPHINTTVHQLQFLKNGQQDLQKAIQSFGSTDVHGGLPSMVAQLEEEDYGDPDHHVLHKTLHSDEDMTKIKICFPRLSSKVEDWIFFPSVKDECCDEAEFEVIDQHLDTPLSGTSSSIETVSVTEDKDIGNEWLLKSPFQVQKGGLESSKISVRSFEGSFKSLSSSSCTTSPVEDNSLWLLPGNRADIAESLCILPDISTVCKANEKCKSFQDCCCTENCAITALRKQVKNMSVEDSVGTVNDMVNQLFRDHLKVMTAKMDKEKWLMESSSCSKKGSCCMSSSSGSNTLSSCNASCAMEAFGKMSINSSNVNLKDWLLYTQNNDEQGQNFYGSKVKEMFRMYFDPTDKTQWVLGKN